jgi:phosphoglycolate phosphatase-like HAD superfamily hydrolase
VPNKIDQSAGRSKWLCLIAGITMCVIANAMTSRNDDPAAVIALLVIVGIHPDVLWCGDSIAQAAAVQRAGPGAPTKRRPNCSAVLRCSTTVSRR